MIILTYKKASTAQFIVERFDDDAMAGAEVKASQVCREGATEVYLSRALKQYAVSKVIDVVTL